MFAEPWQASAFALAVCLSERGAFAWSDWSAALGQEIEAAAQRTPEGGAAHYHRWLDALERLCCERGLIDAAEIERRREEWREAYLNTPHGQPVDLTAASHADEAAARTGATGDRPARDDWRQAYLNTPHGPPVDLTAATRRSRR